jgi:hypothetical protein
MNKNIIKKILYLTIFAAIILFVGGDLLRTKSADAAWYSGTWGYRKQISINKNKVAGGSNLSNFTMLFSVTDPDLKSTGNGGRVGKTDGTDILFTSSDGTTKLNHEIEYYSPTTGQLVAWVQVPTVSASLDTQLFVYYGNAAASDQQAVTSTWESNYKAVWHLNQTATSTSKYILDSTSNANNASSTGTSYPVPFGSGQIGGAQDFDGTDDYLNADDAASLDLSSSYTVSAWVNADALMGGSTSQRNSILSKGDSTEASGGDHNYLLGYNGLAGFGTVVRWLFVLENSAGTNCNLVGDTAGATSSWYNVTGVFDDAGDTMYLYVNGQLQNSTACALTVNTNNRPVRIGDDEHTAGIPWDGRIDEVRIYNTAKTAGMVATEYNNQYSPNTFYSYGTAENVARSTTGNSLSSTLRLGPSWYNSSWLYRKPISISKSRLAATSTPYLNFPVLISTTNVELKSTGNGGRVGKSDGTDIVFVDSSGSKLSHEIEKYDATTGQLVAWVKISSLPTTEDTTIYMYYGNAAATDQQDTTNVWTGQTYRAVYHMNGTTDVKNARNLTTDGTVVSNGIIGNGYLFNGTSQEAYGSNFDADNDTNLTLSIWITPQNLWDSAENASRIFDIISGGDSNGCKLSYDDSVDGGLEFKCTLPSVGLSGATYTTTFASGTPVYIVGTFDDTNNLQKLYVNGVNVGTNGTFTQSILYNSGVTMYADIAARITGLDHFSDMVADEARVIGNVLSAEWIQTEYNNQSSPQTFAILGDTQSYSGAASWYSPLWVYRKKITIDRSKITSTSGPLNNFPVVITVTDPDLRYTGSSGFMGKSDATDLVVTWGDGVTKLDHEIESYNSSTGEIVLWVEVPILSSGSDTPLYIYFGNSGAADQQNVNGVWDSNYKLVWHLPNGSSLSANDSTSNANNGTVSSATATGGKVGGGANFSGSSQEITRSNNSSLGVGAGDSTISAWIYINSYASAAAVYDKGASGTCDYSFFVTSETSGHIAYGNSGVSSWTGTGFTTGMWHYLTVTQTGGTATVYLDGVQNFTKAVIVAANTTASLSLGGNPSTGGSYWNGKIDEFRISGTIRSTDWMTTEYNNQYNPSSFYSYGGLERYGSNSRSSTSGASTPAIKIRGGVKFR